MANKSKSTGSIVSQIDIGCIRIVENDRFRLCSRVGWDLCFRLKSQLSFREHDQEI